MELHIIYLSIWYSGEFYLRDIRVYTLMALSNVRFLEAIADE